MLKIVPKAKKYFSKMKENLKSQAKVTKVLKKEIKVLTLIEIIPDP